MKLFLFVLSFSSLAFSMEVYNCAIKAKDKNSSYNTSMETNVLLSDKVTNLAHIGSTKLELTISQDKKIEGYVNGQRNFILEGSVKQAKFESATEKGSITCGQAMNVGSLFYSRSSKVYFASHSSVDTYSLNNNSICFIGDSVSAANELAKSNNLKIAATLANAVSVSYQYTECVQGNGLSYDAYECLKEQTSVVTSTVENCFSDENVHP